MSKVNTWERFDAAANPRLDTCQTCGEAIFKIQVELSSPLGERAWWHENELLDAQHPAVPGGKAA